MGTTRTPPRQRTEQRLELRRAFRNADSRRKKVQAVARIGSLEAESDREWVKLLNASAAKRI